MHEIELLISTSFLPDGTDIVVSEGTDTWTVTVKDNQATFKGPKKTKAGDYIYTGTITQFDINSPLLVSVKEPSQKIDPPTADTHTYTYNGAKQTYSPVGFDPAAMVMENGLQKDAGTYEVKVVPKDGYVWTDGTREPVIFTWAINPKYVGGFKWTEPDSKVYDGTPLNIGISCEDICSGDDCRLNCTIHKDSADGEAVTEAKDPGTYVCVPDNQLSGRDSANYELSGPLPENKTYTIKEPSQKIDPPTADTHTYTYNGAKQMYSPVGFDPAAMVMENGLQKEAGTYEVKVVPKDGYVWTDGTREPVIFTWAINPKYVGGFKWTEPDSKVYDGTPLNIGISCEDICSGDDCRLNCTIHKDSADGEAVTEAKDPGTYVGVPDNQLSGKAAGNYIVSGSLPEAKTYTIMKKEEPKKDEPSSEPDQVFTGTWNEPVANGSWTMDANGIWHYATTRRFADTWGYIVNPYAGGQPAWFRFDAYGNMLTGWQLINGKWYYLNPTKDGTLGACQLGGVTPDGWTVDESGAWVESIPRK